MADDPVESLRQQCADLSKELEKTRSGLEGAAKKIKALEGETEKANTVLGKLHQSFKKTTQELVSFGHGVLSVAGAGAVLELSFASLLTSSKKYAETVYELSREAKVLGQDFSSLTQSIDSLSKASLFSKQASAEFVKSLQTNIITARMTGDEITALGISLSREFVGNVQRAAHAMESFKQVADKDASALHNLQTMTPEQLKDWVSTLEVLGKVTASQADEYYRMYNAMRTGDEVLDAETQRAKDLVDSYAKLKKAGEDLVLMLGDNMAPVMEKVNEILTSLINVFKSLDPTIIKVGMSLAAAVALVGPFLPLLAALGPAGAAIGAIAVAGAGVGAYSLMSGAGGPKKKEEEPKKGPSIVGRKVDTGDVLSRRLEQEKLKYYEGQAKALEGINQAYQAQVDYALKVSYNVKEAQAAIDMQLVTIDKQIGLRQKEVETWQKLHPNIKTVEQLEARVRIIAKARGLDELATLGLITTETEQLQRVQQIHAEIVSLTGRRVQKQMQMGEAFQAEVEMAKARVSLAEANLNLTKSFFLGMGPQIDQMRAVVNELDNVKEGLKKDLEVQMQLIRAGTADNVVRKRAFELQAEIVNITQKQVDMTKDLREGYLTALSAFSNVTGSMAKIIGRKEMAIGSLLRKGMAETGLQVGGKGQAGGFTSPQARFASGTGALEEGVSEAERRRVVEARGGKELSKFADVANYRPRVQEQAALAGMNPAQQAAAMGDATKKGSKDGAFEGTYAGAKKALEDAKGARGSEGAGGDQGMSGVRSDIKELTAAIRQNTGSAKQATKEAEGEKEKQTKEEQAGKKEYDPKAGGFSQYQDPVTKKSVSLLGDIWEAVKETPAGMRDMAAAYIKTTGEVVKDPKAAIVATGKELADIIQKTSPGAAGAIQVAKMVADTKAGKFVGDKVGAGAKFVGANMPGVAAAKEVAAAVSNKLKTVTDPISKTMTTVSQAIGDAKNAIGDSLIELGSTKDIVADGERAQREFGKDQEIIAKQQAAAQQKMMSPHAQLESLMAKNSEQAKEQVAAANEQTAELRKQTDQGKQAANDTRAIRNNTDKAALAKGLGDTLAEIEGPPEEQMGPPLPPGFVSPTAGKGDAGLSKAEQDIANALSMTEAQYRAKEDEKRAQAAKMQLAMQQNPVVAPDMQVGIGGGAGAGRDRYPNKGGLGGRGRAAGSAGPVSRSDTVDATGWRQASNELKGKRGVQENEREFAENALKVGRKLYRDEKGKLSAYEATSKGGTDLRITKAGGAGHSYAANKEQVEAIKKSAEAFKQTAASTIKSGEKREAGGADAYAAWKKGGTALEGDQFSKWQKEKTKDTVNLLKQNADNTKGTQKEVQKTRDDAEKGRKELKRTAEDAKRSMLASQTDLLKSEPSIGTIKAGGNVDFNALPSMIASMFGMAAGGRIPGVGSSDNVPAMLTPGEFVINKQASQQFLPLLKAINKNRYALGGTVGSAGFDMGGGGGGVSPRININVRGDSAKKIMTSVTKQLSSVVNKLLVAPGQTGRRWEEGQ